MAAKKRFRFICHERQRERTEMNPNFTDISEDIVRELFPKRKKDSHKGNYGRILILAGSRGMCGAACLCSQAALRTGSGLVSVGIPGEFFDIVQIKVSEATCVDRNEFIDYSKYDAVAIGPGLGMSRDSADLVQHVLKTYEGPLVVDADGLNIIAECDYFRYLKARKGETVITPHPGEARRLLGEEFYAELSEKFKDGEPMEKGSLELRLLEVNALQEKTGAVAVLKGAETLISNGRRIYRNTTGNPGMATGGSGDVLTGIICSLLGQGHSASDSAYAGVYVHGLAGDLGEMNIGEYGLTAGDIAEYTALAIKQIAEDRDGLQRI